MSGSSNDSLCVAILFSRNVRNLSCQHGFQNFVDGFLRREISIDKIDKRSANLEFLMERISLGLSAKVRQSQLKLFKSFRLLN